MSFKRRGTSAVPNIISSRIVRAYEALPRRNGDFPHANPVQCVGLAASGNEGEVYLDEVRENVREGEGGAVGVGEGESGRNDDALSERPLRDQLRVMHSSIFQMRSQLEDLIKNIAQEQVTTRRNYSILNANIRRYMNKPARPLSRNTRLGVSEGHSNYVASVSLSPNPRTIYDLWEEWTVGIGGRKPAKDFTAVERGKVKYKYCRRKIVWDLITKLVKGGMTAHVAMDNILETYGRCEPLTKLINMIMRDRRNGVVPQRLRL